MANNSQPIPISYVSLGSSASYIEFANIPQGFAHLYIEMCCRTTDSGSVVVSGYFNTDSTQTNYAYYTMQGSLTNTISGYGAGDTCWLGIQNHGSTTSNSFGTAITIIPNYSKSDRQKSWYMKGGVSANSSGNIYYEELQGLWRNTAAITTIRFSPAGGSFTTGTSIAIYGVNNTNTIGAGNAPTTTP
jgi:hypothetical protein